MTRCGTCDGTGEIACLCGGDACLCGEEYDICPDCEGLSWYCNDE